MRLDGFSEPFPDRRCKISCTNTCTSGAGRTFVRTMTPKSNIINRIADRVDLAIDFLTLGQYGLESVETSARDAGCEGGGLDCGRREALAPARNRGCEGFGRPAAPQPAA